MRQGIEGEGKGCGGWESEGEGRGVERVREQAVGGGEGKKWWGLGE